MTTTFGVGIIGCGSISTTYFEVAPLFRGFEIRACADIVPEVARKAAEKYGVGARTVDELLASDDIAIVVNLTIPEAHYAVTMQALEAGKHVYSEKPLTLSVDDGKAVAKLAGERNLRVGCTPDTFLGGAHQLARKTLDDGAIGKVVAGAAFVLSHGMEHWHPNPDFFFQPGGGPMLDLGPYYIGNLINLVGPVRRVAALTSAATPTRTITSEPRNGEEIPVDTPTNIQALLEFENGATVTLLTSWDVWAHNLPFMELYGLEGTLFVPDPNFFGGTVRMAGRDREAVTVEGGDHPFSVVNRGGQANYRTVGLADMAVALAEGRDHRCSLERTLHAVDIMLSVLESGETGEFVTLTTTCTRPEPLGVEEARALLK